MSLLQPFQNPLIVHVHAAVTLIQEVVPLANLYCIANNMLQELLALGHPTLTYQHLVCVDDLSSLRTLSALPNKSKKLLTLSCNFYSQIYSVSVSVHRTKIYGDKGCHTALKTIKRGNQHAVPNRNPKHNHIETTYSLLVSPRLHFDKNSENTDGQHIYTYI